MDFRQPVVKPLQLHHVSRVEVEVGTRESLLWGNARRSHAQCTLPPTRRNRAYRIV